MEVPSYEFDILVEKKAKTKYTCPICQEIIIYTFKSNCNHRFCKFCITKWKLYFHQCPVCREKITTVVPHPRTDKWIQQLFDLATPELRQDREMCVNYRKLQQIKLDLIGKEADLSPFFNNNTELLDPISLQANKEPAKIRDNKSSKSGASSLNNLSMVNHPVSPYRPNDELQSLYMKSNYSDEMDVNPSTTHLLQSPLRDRSDDVSNLFGTPSRQLFRHSTTNISESSSHPNRFQRRISQEVMNDPLVTEDNFPSGINSAHTYCLHFPAQSQGTHNLRLAELTYHDELATSKADEGGGKIDKDTNANNKVGGGEGDSFPRSMILRDSDQQNGSEIVRSINTLKAEAMCARIQHQIAMASLPNIKRVRSQSSKTTIPADKQPSQNQREKQDLQSCKEALLNLRLRLLPPSKTSSATLAESDKRNDRKIRSDIQVSILRQAMTNQMEVRNGSCENKTSPTERQ